MGLENRPYMDGDDEDRKGRVWKGGNIRLELPRPTIVTMILIAFCTVLYFLTIPQLSTRGPIRMFGVLLPDCPGQIWRFITFQFLHADAQHFLFNMVGLYFFAPPLERVWRWKKFLVFYLVCGIGAGLAFLSLSAILGANGFLVGASGGILGCLMACAILFPDTLVVIFPIRWVAAFYVALYVLEAIFEYRLDSAAHLGGMVTAMIWIWTEKRLVSKWKIGERMRQGAWKRRMESLAHEQEQVDRILKKVHDEGIQSLTSKEKKFLQEATKRQQQRDRARDKM